jgi:uroporphyrinogen-III synthase
MDRTMAAETNGLRGLRVLSLESRRAAEMAKLIANYGGEPVVAPSMCEVPLESNTRALEFAKALANGSFDAVIFLTGVGTRALARIVETVYPLEQFVTELKRVQVVVRGPKPLAVMKELGVPVALAAPEPNTWRELLAALAANAGTVPLRGRRVAVQEYGESNRELLAGLAQRGAAVTAVPVYQWALPEDTAPLRKAVDKICAGEIDMALFTTSVQIVHLMHIAKEMGKEGELDAGLERVLVGSIGPVTSEELRQNGVRVDFEPEHPRMGILVNAAARRASAAK